MLILSLGHIGFFIFSNAVIFRACEKWQLFSFFNHPKDKGVADELFFDGKRVFGNSNVTEYIFVQPTLVHAGAGYIFYFIAVMRRKGVLKWQTH